MQIADHIFFHIFDAPTHFPTRIFQKYASRPRWEAHFRKMNFSTSDQTHHFFAPWKASRKALLPIWLALVAPMAVPIAIFPRFEPFGILRLAHDLCIFSLRSPVSKNDRMRRTHIFVNFVAIDATLHQTCKLQAIFFILFMLQLTFRLAFSKSMLPALGGEHIFAKRVLALPIKHIPFLRSGRPRETPFWTIWLALVAPMAVQIAIFPLFEPFGILRLAHDLCIFSLWNPDNSNDCVHFVRHLPFSSYFYCRMHPLDASWYLFFYFFAFFLKMCSPPSVGSTLSKNDFCKYSVQEEVSIPKFGPKPPLMGGHSHLVLCKK